MAEDVKIYVSETVERIDVKVSDPFPVSVIPTGTLEINDIKANTLSSVESGGSIPSEIYGWFKAKFTSLVDKLLSSWVHGLIFITKAIDEALTSLQRTVSEHATSLEVIDGRLDAIEDKLIVNYVVPVDAAEINLTTDKNGNPLNFQDGDAFEIVIQVKQYSPVNRINLRFNNNSNSIYKISTNELNYFYTAATNYLSQYSTVEVNFINREVQGYVINHSKNGSGTYTSMIYSFHTENLDALNIYSINLYRNTVTSNIPAGTIIIIRRK